MSLSGIRGLKGTKNRQVAKLAHTLVQEAGTRCGSFDNGIWFAWYFLNTIVTNETFSVIFHLPDCKAISNTMQHQESP